MQLREIHVDGFGALTRRSLTGLGPGLNVLFGNNEQGKTTLLEFVRRVLFGFGDKRSKSNLYLPVHGGKHGGRLVTETAAGERLVIERFAGKGGGPVTLTLGERPLASESLEACLGHASSDLFHNVYAFTLDELHQADSLHGEDIKNRIFGAGLGLGRVSLSAVRDGLQKRAEILYKKKGSKQKLAALYQEALKLDSDISEIQERLADYDRKVGNLSQLETRRKDVAERFEELDRKRRHLETLMELYPNYVEMESARKQLVELSSYPPFPKDSENKYQRVRTETQVLTRKMHDAQETLEGLRLERARVLIDSVLLARESDVERLRQSLSQVRDAQKDCPMLVQKLDIKSEDIDNRVQRTGLKWDRQAILEFVPTSEEREQLQGFQERHDELRRQKSEAKNKWDLHRENQAGQTRPPSLPAWLMGSAFGLLGLGGVALLAGAFMADITLALAGLVLAGWGGGLWWKLKRAEQEQEPQPDTLGEELERSYQLAEDAIDQFFAEWNGWKAERNLPEGTGISGVQSILRQIEDIQKMEQDRAELKQRIDQVTEKIEQAKDSVVLVTKSIEDFIKSGDVITDIDRLLNLFDEHKQKQQTGQALDARIEDQTAALNRMQAQVDELANDLKQLIVSVGAEDEDGFLNRAQKANLKHELERVLEDQKKIIQGRVGLENAYKECIDVLQRTSPGELEAQLEDAVSKLGSARQEQAGIDEAVGETRNEVQHLASRDDLLTLQTRLEMVKQEMHEASREWAVAQMAVAYLDSARRRYETTRQPGVVRAAQSLFEQITEGRYPRLIKPIEGDELLIEDKEGRTRNVMEMSRGTREQLYLAMRFGLIEEYESRAEPLPVIMDDVFVNFDDDRKPRVVEILNEFAKDRQVLLLTCHRHSLEWYEKFGAHRIDV